MDLDKPLLGKSFFWFAMIMTLFGVVTEVWGQNVFLSSYFYLQLAVIGFLAAIFIAVEKEK